MAWVADDLVLSTVAGTTTADGDVISKVFSVEDPRYLVVDVQGGLTNFELEGRVGNGSWFVVKAQTSGSRLVFCGPQEIATIYPGDGAELLPDQLRIVSNASGNVDHVWITRVL